MTDTIGPVSELHRAWSEWLNDAMDRTGVTKRELIIGTRSRDQTVGQWIKGHAIPSDIKCRLIAKVLGVSATEVLAAAGRVPDNAERPERDWDSSVAEPPLTDVERRALRRLLDVCMDLTDEDLARLRRLSQMLEIRGEDLG